MAKRLGAAGLRLSSAVVTATLVMLSMVGSARAQSFTVTTTDDVVDANIGDGMCDDGNGRCSLRAAIQEGNSNPSPSTIQLPAGLYRLTIAGTDEDDAATGDLDVKHSVDIRGEGAASTIIDANHLDSAIHVPEPMSVVNVDLRRVTVRNAAGPAVHGAYGAIVLESVIRDNAGDGLRAGWFLVAASEISHNDGIGVCCAAYDGLSSSIQVSSVHSNSGPGVLVDPGLVGFDADGEVFVLESRIGDNGAGGVVLGSAGIVVVELSTVDGNQGGGLVDATGPDPGLFIVIGSTIADNTATRGAGISLADCAWLATLNITISGNRADEDGGGLFLGAGCTARPELSFATITANVADADGDGSGAGGGIFDDGVGSGTLPMRFKNTILAGNAAPTAPDCSATIVSEGGLLLGDEDGCALSSVASDLVGVDPLLAELADNGGATQTHALTASSPAIDAADDDCKLIDSTLGVEEDQRGYSRPHGATCDLGAFETGCNDGVIDDGEDCDVGGSAAGGCCSPLCRYETQGVACDAGDPCGGPGACDGMGQCAAQPLSCRQAGRSRLLVRASAQPSRNTIAWKWLLGEELSAADLGDPLVSTGYTLCVDDTVANVPVRSSTLIIPAGPGWRAANSTRVRYRAGGEADGVRMLEVRAGDAERSRAKLKAKGIGVPLPAPAAPDRLFRQEDIVRVRLVNAAGVCLESQFEAAETVVNDVARFKASAVR